MSANKPFVEFSLTHLCQSRRASSSFVKICFHCCCCCFCCCCCCCHNLLKYVNDSPTCTVHISWQICAKFGTRELHITLNRCEFPANQAVKDRLYLGWWYEFPHSFYIFIRFRQKKILHTSCPQKFITWLCASWKPAQGVYIYRLRKCVNELVLLLYTLIARFLWNSAWEFCTKWRWLFVSFLLICTWKTVHLLWAHLMCVPYNRYIFKPEYTSTNPVS